MSEPTQTESLLSGRPPWSSTAERAAIAAFWAFLAALEIVRRTVNPFGPPSQVGAAAYVGVLTYVFWALLTPPIFRLARRLPLERGAGARRLALLGFAGFTVAVSIELVQFLLIRMMIDPGAIPARIASSLSEIGPLDVVLRLWFLDDFVIFLAVGAVGYARNYFIRLRERERESAQFQAETASLQAQLADARLSALRMQLNPHFLFNTLHTVSSLAEDDPEGVQRIVARLSKLLRWTLEGSTRHEVALTEELSFLRDYLEIQRVRFHGSLEVQEDVDAAALEALVPNLILQPLVENAVKHSGEQENGAVSRIILHGHRDADRLIIGVRDNGPGLAEGAEERAAQAGRVGLANTRARLHAMYGSDATLGLSDAPEGGLAATITLPYHTAADLRGTAGV